MATQRRRIPARRLVGAAVVVVLIAALSSARFYTDLLWFEEVGLTSVLWKSLSTQFILGAVVAVTAALIVWGNVLIAARLAPTYRVGIVDPRFQQIERYRELLAPLMRWLRLGIAAVVGLMAGLAAAPSWETLLLWMNRVAFGVKDPQFGRDVGFYVFELPLYEAVIGWVMFAIFAALVLSIASHVLNGSIGIQSGVPRIQPGALAHISVLLGVIALVRAVGYWLGQYSLNFSARGVVDGASYTDVHAQLPALKLLAVISIISAILFLVNIAARRITLPVAAVAIWILTAFVAGGVWPWWVQRFSVNPQELQREEPFIGRNIIATREGFGLTDVETQTYAATTTLSAAQIETNDAILQNVRVWDPDVLQRANEQLQAIRTYYRFEDVDIDRYEIGGEKRQVLLSARELSIDDLEERSKTWSNEHLQFTHGFGIVASFANAATASGQPQYIVRDVPGTVSSGAETLEVEQPAIYYGESFSADEYSIVNSEQEEVDYPTDQGVQRSQYEGAGGVELSGPLRRVAFALREGESNLLLSGLITDESRILIYRDIRDRVLRAAPFLSLDHDPYVAVVDGRLTWILDGYTSSNDYPYSQAFDLSAIVPQEYEGVLRGTANYVRNSVKIAVDAYDGTMKFYVIDESDPLIRAWRNAFPALFTTEEPSEDLVAHFRYPEDLFDVQSEVYLTYHMTDPEDFYAKEDAWSLPVDPQAASTDPRGLPGRYLLTQLPGETEQEFVLSRPATPRSKNNMVALMIARSDPGNYGQFLALQFPRQKQVPGPIQVDNVINQDVEISQAITLLSQRGSNVEFGSQVVLPLEDSILYIQPIFVTAENVGIPELKKVAIVLGDEAVMEDTLEEALLEMFGASEPVEPEPTPTEEPEDGEEPAERTLEDIVRAAASVYAQAQDALADGDFEEYGRLIERLGRLLDEAAARSGSGR
ncbi:MAG TPA: UPF0182 family protein [Actinomycetota bacterium]|nr:UPF0182 family protein [Actinomycetota bacterium]